MARALFALLAAALFGQAFGQSGHFGCLRERIVSPDSVDPDRHLEQARCWLSVQRPGEALLSVERFLALRPGDPRGAALQDSILRLLGHRPGDPSGSASALAGERPTARGWLAVVGGYDSNANSGTDAREISLPLFRGLIVDLEEKFGDLRGRSSALIGAHAGVDATVPASAQTKLQFLGAAGGRLNFNAVDYLPHDYRLRAEADHRAGATRYGLWLESDLRWIGRYRTLDAQIAGIRVSTAAWRGHEIGAFAAAIRNELPVFELRTREQRIGLALRHAALPVRLTAFQGAERARGDSKMLDRDIRGVAAELSFHVGAGRLDISALTTRSDYVQFSQLFLSRRLDRFRELQVSYEHALSRAWTVTPRLILQQNRSNVSLTRFSRNQFLTELRWSF